MNAVCNDLATISSTYQEVSVYGEVDEDLEGGEGGLSGILYTSFEFIQLVCRKKVEYFLNIRLLNLYYFNN